MKITVLVENTSIDPNLKTEHGLSLFIETKKHKILFDTGESDLFLINAKKLGIDLSLVDMCVLSHGHKDHGGGLNHFLEVNHKAVVYVQQRAFEPHFSKRDGRYHDISVKVSKNNIHRIMYTADYLRIDDELMLFSKITGIKFYPSSNKNLYMDEDDRFSLDDFKHEQNLLITENNNHYLIAGCAHRGMINILDEAQKIVQGRINAVVGGLHLISRSGLSETEDRIVALGHELRLRITKILTCHCTGEKAYSILQPILKTQITYIKSGSVIDLD